MEQFPIEKIIDSFENNLSREEKERLEVWLETSAKNQRTYNETKKIFENTKKLRTNFHPDERKALQKVNRHLKTKQIVRWSYRVAAIFVLAAFVSKVFIDSQKQEWTEIVSENRQTIFLPDNSKVILAENSTFRYPNDFDEKQRTVFLNGKAYFEITKDSICPFVVNTQNTQVKVLGTRFLVDAAKVNQEQVLVDEGKVAFSLLKETKLLPTILTQNEMGTWNSQQNKITESQFHNSNINYWLSGWLSFNNMPLLELAENLEKHFSIKIEISDKSYEAIRFSGNFDSPTPEEALLVICQTINLTFEKEGNKYILKP